jgi:hypothetical protein
VGCEDGRTDEIDSRERVQPPNPDRTHDRTCSYMGFTLWGLCAMNGEMCNDDKLMKSSYSVHKRMHIISAFFSN